MPRPRTGEPTQLGAELRRRRGDRALADVAEEIGFTHTTLSRIERGARLPSTSTARKLARWLGWTVGQVFDAAETPANMVGFEG